MKIRRACPERQRSGFTLIEMMVVVTVLAIIAGIGSSMLFSILRGSTKTQTMLMVKQQGEFATLVMERMIRNARSIEHTSSGPTSYTSNSLKIINPDGFSTTFSCANIDNSPDGKFEIASTSASLVSAVDRLTSADVAVENCNLFTITKGQAGINPDTVRINFKLSPSIQGNRPEEQSTVTFDTTVSLRNY